jgi:hypothetical protein
MRRFLLTTTMILSATGAFASGAGGMPNCDHPQQSGYQSPAPKSVPAAPMTPFIHVRDTTPLLPATPIPVTPTVHTAPAVPIPVTPAPMSAAPITHTTTAAPVKAATPVAAATPAPAAVSHTTSVTTALTATSHSVSHASSSATGGTVNVQQSGYGGHSYNNTPDLGGIALSGGNPCTVSASAGITGPGLGVLFGASGEGHNCVLRQTAAMLANMGQGVAAMEILCQSGMEVRVALANAGTPCLIDRRRWESAGWREGQGNTWVTVERRR